MARKLKVFRTAAGFHDAYVAAPSRKAALAAWGSDADLFARGVAEEVTDPALTEEPLARPGEVVKRSRGSAAEQFAALPPDPPKAKAKAGAKLKSSAGRAGAPAKPKPSRDALEVAEAALAQAEARHRAAQDELAERQAALDREKRALAAEWRRERDGLEEARAEAEEAYAAALADWRA